MVEVVSFFPEVQFKDTKIVKITGNLFFIPENDIRAQAIKKDIENNVDKVSGGSYFCFNGEIKKDGTYYEIFQSLALAFTFLYQKRIICRVYKKEKESSEYFIDEYDKFRYDKADSIQLKRKDITTIAKFHIKILDRLASPDYDPLENSLEFFYKSLIENEPKLRILYLCIALESIFLSDSNNGELNYKLGIRGSSFLFNFDSSVVKKDIFMSLKNGYGLRSKIIHGDDYDKELNKTNKDGKFKESDHSDALEDIIRQSITHILLDDDIYNLTVGRGLGKYIDDSIILFP